ncbi:hypothetical protein T10_4126 [Trichinella papuae]|uniref:Uncharacterized protein n=1 Tax=Trichinella papuae TaxID=268474 RepID=A0A0V1M1N7_9BILA|nr:hypothetical protein T10_4126 [Trichinella papuae]
MGRPRIDEALTFHVAQQKVCEEKVPTENGFVTLATVSGLLHEPDLHLPCLNSWCKHALYCNIGSTVTSLEEDEVCGSPLLQPEPQQNEHNRLAKTVWLLVAFVGAKKLRNHWLYGFVFICSIAVTKEVSDLARRVLIHCAGDVLMNGHCEMALQIHDVRRRDSSVLKNHSEEPGNSDLQVHNH